jgi:hypothetical protein
LQKLTKSNIMSKIKEIDDIAQGVADMTKEIMYDSIEWQIADQPVNGDEFYELHSYVMSKAIEILYKQNTKPVDTNAIWLKFGSSEIYTQGELKSFTNKIRNPLDNNIK